MLRTIKKLFSSGYKKLNNEDEDDDIIVISSTAGAAEWQSSKLGEFLACGKFEGRPAWRQRDTMGQGCFLYSKEGGWRVGTELGGDKSALLNRVDSSKPPFTGWKFRNAKEWLSDSSLVLRPGGLQPATTLEVEVLGQDLLRSYKYKITSDWSNGRPVYVSETLLGKSYLMIEKGVGWCVNSRSGVLCSGRGTNCPADLEAGGSIRMGWRGWSFWRNGAWVDLEVTVRARRTSD